MAKATNPHQVVIDASVLVAAARARLGASFHLLNLFAATDTRWEWNISTALLLEYEVVLKREQNRLGRDLIAAERLLDDIAGRANRHAILYLVRPFLTDADDELVLELALASASASNYIVTHNRDDFREADRFGISVVTPAEVL